MNQSRVWINLSCLSGILLIFVSSCSLTTSVTITGTVEFIQLEELPEASASDDQQVFPVTISRQSNPPSGELRWEPISFFDIASSDSSGFLWVVDGLDLPERLQISVDIGGEEPLTCEVVATPNAKFEFKLQVSNDPQFASLRLVGNVHNVLDDSKYFSIHGDLSSTELDPNNSSVRIRSGEYTPTGERVGTVYGDVLLKEGKFLIEAEVDEPRVVNILVIDHTNQEYGQTQGIIEPGAELELTTLGTLRTLLPSSPIESSKHHSLIDEWQQRSEYVELLRVYQSSYYEAQQAPTSTSQEAEPEYRSIMSRLRQLKFDFLDKIARSTDDSMDALLALSLGAFWGDENAQPIYNRLAQEFDEDFVARRIRWQRIFHAENLAARGVDSSLQPGVQVPDFTLTSITNETVTLSEILKTNQLVLVEFWAPWCGPCIEAIPELKATYEAKHENGFEIVSICIDSEVEDWNESSEKYALPWVNLAEPGDWNGPVVSSFGITFIPKNYLLDSSGSILKKDISPADLALFLNNNEEDQNSNE